MPVLTPSAIFPVTDDSRFTLPESFLDEYRDRPVQWGFGDLSYFTYKRTYARPLDPDNPEGQVEDWWQSVARVVNGVYTTQKTHCMRMGLPWSDTKALRSAAEMYHRIFTFKFMPAGRGLWAMGTDFVFERGAACLQSCGFVSTRNIDVDFAYPFAWTFGMSMLGVGIGYDTRGAGKVTVQTPERSNDTHVIPDSREGWIAALERLLNAYVGVGSLPANWDLSLIRPEGTYIKGFGGQASGPAPLQKMFVQLEYLYDGYIGKLVDSELIVDTNNMTGACVVSGGVRRTAQISFGDADDAQFMDLKQDLKKVKEYRYASNNTIWADNIEDYSVPAERTALNGEPGYAWLNNMQRYGRMADPPTDADHRVLGGNPCLEQSLESEELCNLVETLPFHHDTFEDYQRTLKFAYLYAKTVTLIPTHDPRTNAVMGRNRRIGCSMSGIRQHIAKFGVRELLSWCDQGYQFVQQLDSLYSEWLCVPNSIKTTSVKPSGTISLLAGATPGIHAAEDDYYFRRVRVTRTSPLIPALEAAGYILEEAVQEANTVVVTFPVHHKRANEQEALQRDLTIWEQVSLASLLQKHWADNQVSCTVKFKTDEASQIKTVLEHFEHSLKGISFLPFWDAAELRKQVDDHGEPLYHQLPYESVTEKEYLALKSQLRPLDLSTAVHEVTERFCDSASCEVRFD